MRSTVLSAEALAALIVSEIENIDYYLWRGTAGVPSQLPTTGGTFTQLRGIPVHQLTSTVNLTLGFLGQVSNTDTPVIAVSQEFYLADATAAMTGDVFARFGAQNCGIRIAFNSDVSITITYIDHITVLTILGTFPIVSNSFNKFLVKYTLSGISEIFLNDVSIGSVSDIITNITNPFAIENSTTNTIVLHHIKWRFYYT